MFYPFLPQHVIQGPNEHWHADQHLSNGAYGCCYLRRSGLLCGRYTPHVYIHQATRSEQELRQIKNIFDSSYAQVVLEDVYAAGMEVYEVYGAMCWPVNFKRFLQVHLRWSTPPRPT